MEAELELSSYYETFVEDVKTTTSEAQNSFNVKKQGRATAGLLQEENLQELKL